MQTSPVGLDGWRFQAPDKRWMPFSPRASLNFSFNFARWIETAGVGLTLTGGEVLEPDGKLTIGPVVVDGTRLRVRISKTNPEASEDLETDIPFLVRFTASDGQTDGRVFHLRIRNR